MLIQWNDSLAVGVEKIDEEHKAIIQAFNELYEKMRVGKGLEDFQSFLSFVEGYIQSHLLHEEELQREKSYPDYEVHKALHDDFRNDIEAIKTSFVDKEPTNLDLIRLNLKIKDWLIYHIQEIDTKLAAYLNAQ